MDLNELYLPRKGRSSAAGDLHKSLPAKGKLVLCELRNPGVIGQIDGSGCTRGACASFRGRRSGSGEKIVCAVTAPCVSARLSPCPERKCLADWSGLSRQSRRATC